MIDKLYRTRYTTRPKLKRVHRTPAKNSRQNTYESDPSQQQSIDVRKTTSLTMADTENLNSLFASVSTSSNGLEPDVLGVLESILRLYSINPQELFYKWESYCLKMGAGAGAANDDSEIKLDINTARMFQKDVRDGFEKGHLQAHHQKGAARGSERKHTGGVTATPKAARSDVFGMSVVLCLCLTRLSRY